MTAFTERGARRSTGRATDAQAQVGTPEQRYADLLDAQEFHRIKKFVAACRRRWPGAVIVLRPNQGGVPAGAKCAAYSEPAPERT